MKNLLAALLSTFLISNAWGATYSFTVPAYPAQPNAVLITNHTTCVGALCGNYIAGMTTSGTITTSGPLAANLPALTNISGLITAYSFFDGLTTYNNTNADARIYRFQVGTDAAGNITSSNIGLQLWKSGTANNHAAGDRFDYLTFDSTTASNSVAFHNISCAVGGVAGSTFTTALDTCFNPASPTTDTAASRVAPLNGTWSTVSLANTPVPTLNEWALISLSVMLGLGAMVFMRKRNHFDQA